MTNANTVPDRVHRHDGNVLLVAARSLGVDVEQADAEYIGAVSKLAAIIDDMVDIEKKVPDLAGILQDPNTALAGRFSAEEDASLVYDVMNCLTDEQKQVWLRAEALPQHAEAKRTADSVQALSAHLTRESELFADIFSLFPRGTSDSQAREHFNIWLKHFSRGGYHVDQAVDMRSDFNDGRVRLRPTLRTKEYLWRIAIHELRESLRMVNSPKFLGALGKTALATIREGDRSVYLGDIYG